jgi:hypothetical protein
LKSKKREIPLYTAFSLDTIGLIMFLILYAFAQYNWHDLLRYIPISTIAAGKVREPEQHYTIAFFAYHARIKYVSYAEWNRFLKKKDSVLFLPRLVLERFLLCR